MKFTLTDNFQSSWLQGSIDTSYNDLVACFGEPNGQGDDYKVQVEWSIEFEDGTYATIYDWKEGDNYNGAGNGTHYTRVTDWHIGGNSFAAVDCVHRAMNAHLQKTCYQEPKLLA